MTSWDYGRDGGVQYLVVCVVELHRRRHQGIHVQLYLVASTARCSDSVFYLRVSCKFHLLLFIMLLIVEFVLKCNYSFFFGFGQLVPYCYYVHKGFLCAILTVANSTVLYFALISGYSCSYW